MKQDNIYDFRRRYMKKNMGTVDRILRVTVAVLIGVLYLTGQISGLAAIVLGIIAIIFVATSIVSTCPLYVPLGISTRKE
jgi:Na+(H+)/acetate symporter ActP